MKILFVLPDTNYVKEYIPDYTGALHLGLAYMSSLLKNNGHECSLIHIKNERDIPGIGEQAKSHNPDLVAYTSFTHQFPIIQTVSREIKQVVNKPAICGGVHATIEPEEVLKEPGIDMVCIGEGEKVLLELVERLKNKMPIDDIPSLWIKKGKQIIKNPVATLNQDLDGLPWPDRELFDFQNISDSLLGVLNVIATRGCPFQCTYCINHQLQKIYTNKGKYIRFRNYELVIDEIKAVCSKYPHLKYVELLDDTFCLNKEMVRNFCEKYKREIKIPFRVNTHIKLLDENILRWLKQAGCERIAVGIESGNPKIRAEILNRHIENQEIIDKILLSKKLGLEITTYNMLGLPFETIHNILETIKLNAKCNPTALHVSMFQPYPNTGLYEICRKNNLIRDKKVETFFSGTVLKQDSLSEQEVFFAYKYFVIFVRLYHLFGNHPLEKALDKIFTTQKIHGILIKLHPAVFTIVFPLKGTFRILQRIFPRPMRMLKKILRR